MTPSPSTSPSSAPALASGPDVPSSPRAPSGSRALLRAVALLSVASLAIALVAQHVAGMQPCPWCVLQRLVHVAILAVALPACLLPATRPNGPWRPLAAVCACALAVAGVAAATWQGLGPGGGASCALTLADRIVSATGLAEYLPSVFSATASCDEANLPLLGIPFAVWSLAVFALSAVLSGAAAWSALRAVSRAPSSDGARPVSG